MYWARATSGKDPSEPRTLAAASSNGKGSSGGGRPERGQKAPLSGTALALNAAARERPNESPSRHKKVEEYKRIIP